MLNLISSYLQTLSTKGEMDLFKCLIEDYKVYMIPGSMLLCQQPGWFRITFSIRQDLLKEALNRIERALKNKKNYFQSNNGTNIKHWEHEDCLYESQMLVKDLILRFSSNEEPLINFHGRQ